MLFTFLILTSSVLMSNHVPDSDLRANNEKSEDQGISDKIISFLKKNKKTISFAAVLAASAGIIYAVDGQQKKARERDTNQSKVIESGGNSSLKTTAKPEVKDKNLEVIQKENSVKVKRIRRKKNLEKTQAFVLDNPSVLTDNKKNTANKGDDNRTSTQYDAQQIYVYERTKLENPQLKQLVYQFDPAKLFACLGKSNDPLFQLLPKTVIQNHLLVFYKYLYLKKTKAYKGKKSVTYLPKFLSKKFNKSVVKKIHQQLNLRKMIESYTKDNDLYIRIPKKMLEEKTRLLLALSMYQHVLKGKNLFYDQRIKILKKLLEEFERVPSQESCKDLFKELHKTIQNDLNEYLKYDEEKVAKSFDFDEHKTFCRITLDDKDTVLDDLKRLQAWWHIDNDPRKKIVFEKLTWGLGIVGQFVHELESCANNSKLFHDENLDERLYQLVAKVRDTKPSECVISAGNKSADMRYSAGSFFKNFEEYFTKKAGIFVSESRTKDFWKRFYNLWNFDIHE